MQYGKKTENGLERDGLNFTRSLLLSSAEPHVVVVVYICRGYWI